jgi:hypothetical protein
MKMARLPGPALLAAGALALAAMACQAITGPVLGQSEPQSEEARILFTDDFSNPRSGWDRQAYDGGETDYLEGEYRIRVNESAADYWANPGLDLEDVRIDVKARKAAGPDDNDFGIICRYQDIDNFYYLVASSDGFVGILKHKDGSTESLASDSLQPTDAVRQGDATNHLRAECVGSRLTLYVNGDMVAEAADSDFARGDVGLIAGTFDVPGTDIRFDDFQVFTPR